MERTEIEAKLMGIIEGLLGYKQGQVKATDTFVEDLGADSMDMVELTMAIEEEFGVDFPDKEAAKVTTVQDVIDYLADKKIDPPRY